MSAEELYEKMDRLAKLTNFRPFFSGDELVALVRVTSEADVFSGQLVCDSTDLRRMDCIHAVCDLVSVIGGGEITPKRLKFTTSVLENLVKEARAKARQEKAKT